MSALEAKEHVEIAVYRAWSAAPAFSTRDKGSATAIRIEDGQHCTRKSQHWIAHECRMAIAYAFSQANAQRFWSDAASCIDASC